MQNVAHVPEDELGASKLTLPNLKWSFIRVLGVVEVGDDRGELLLGVVLHAVAVSGSHELGTVAEGVVECASGASLCLFDQLLPVVELFGM